MPGMSLSTGLKIGGSYGGGGSYTPLTPASATSPSARPSIAQQAYGISGSGTGNTGPRTAVMGSVGMGVAASIALVFLWWSLPR